MAGCPDINRNFLSANGFGFKVSKLEFLQHFVTEVNLPDINVAPAPEGTPFTGIKFPGDHVTWGEIQVSFMVDEDMKVWTELYRWMEGLGFPKNYEQYKKTKYGPPLPAPTKGNIESDATLFIYTSKHNPNIEIKFTDVWPSNLGELNFSSQTTDAEYIKGTVTFQYLHYELVLSGDE